MNKGADRTVASIETRQGLREIRGTMETWDGSRLFYRAWLPPCRTDKAVLLFHRGHEHSGRFRELVDELGVPGVAYFAWDARGHGMSPGERGRAPSFGCLVRDAEAFARFVSERYAVPVENMVVLGNSVGSVIAAAWMHDYGPRLRGAILGTPALRIRLYLPFALPLLRLWRRVRPNAAVQSYVRPSLLTHDREEAGRYREDKLITRAIAVDVLLGLHDAASRLIDDAGAITTPTLVLSAGSDWVVRLRPQRRFFDGMSARDKEMHVYPGFFHDIFHEKDRRVPVAKAREFLFRVLGPEARRPSYRPADKEGYTHAEYQRLTEPLPLFSWPRLKFTAIAVLMRTVGKLSRGIRLGLATGFNSGRTLDYVYENEARGLGSLGRLVDRAYLGTIGWKGIRARRAILADLLQETIDRSRTDGSSVRVVDIAAGNGRYVLDALERSPCTDIEAELRDADEGSLLAGRKLSEQIGLANVKFVRKDAFAPTDEPSAGPGYDVAVVSGLYELVPDNARVMRSLAGLQQAVRESGYLIYTNQLWHPQLELIARVLPGPDGRPWIMRCRPQAEMDELVLSAGFQRIRTVVEEHGMFSVSIARKATR